MDTAQSPSFTDIPVPQALRPMEVRDLPQVTEIDREAFPTLWPPTPFRRDLQNRAVHYLVTYSPHLPYRGNDAATPQGQNASPQPMMRRLIHRVRGMLGTPEPGVPQVSSELVTGFVGVWLITDEAHITSIAVRQPYRHRGIGELLLLGTLELAVARRCRLATLEVRVSNTPAQALYEKYGFRRMDLRRHYYSDNREDALVMSVESLSAADFRRRLWSLTQAYVARYGEPRRILA